MTHEIRAALVSTDAAFGQLVRETLSSPELNASLRLELTVPFSSYGEEQVRALRQLEPDLVIIDLADDPDLGVRFAQFLAEHARGQRLVAVGPALEPDLLLGIMRAGAIDYLNKPVSNEQLTAAVRRAGQLMGAPEKQSARQPGKLYTFFSAKGGSGATTVATNAAIAIQQLTGKKTLLVDLDLQLGEVALTLGVEPRFNFIDLIKNFHRMDANLLASYIEQHESGVNVLSAPFQPEQAEDAGGEDIRRVLHFLRQHFDYIIVDTSKSFSASTVAAFDQSDAVYIVSTVDLPSLRNIQRALPLLRRVLRRGNDQIRLVVNRYQPDDLISIEEVERTLGVKVYWKLRNDYGAVMGSLNAGKPIVLNGRSPYSQDVRALAADLAGMPASSGTRASGLKSLLGKIRNR